jgi:hypothetical protein
MIEYFVFIINNVNKTIKLLYINKDLSYDDYYINV